MNKYNRSFDQQRMNESKDRTINFVIDKINKPKRSFNIRSRYVLSMALTVFLILFVLVLNTGDGITDQPGVTLSAASVERISEATYITGNLLASEVVLYQSLLTSIADEDTVDFETDIDEFNMYFDILKVFLDEDPINAPVVTLYDGDEYQSTITYTVEGVEYIFNVNIDGENIEGELIVGNIVYQVSGTIIEGETETEVELISRSGDNYIKIQYEKQIANETQTKFKIESRINGVSKEKEIEVNKSNEEAEVKINDNENEYSLKKELEDTGYVYKLEYKIGEIEGEAEIVEEVLNGQNQYSYSIDEDGVHKEIDKHEPSHFGQDDDDEEDEEDEIDPGNNDNPVGGQNN